MSKKNIIDPHQEIINQKYKRLKDKQLSHELDPPCETILMLTEKHFRDFAARVVAAIEAHELALKTESATRVHELDCIWIEAKEIIASINKDNDNP